MRGTGDEMRGTSYVDTGEQEVLTCAVSVDTVRWKTPQVLLIMNDEFISNR
jgi:hypothetical protein